MKFTTKEKVTGATIVVSSIVVGVIPTLLAGAAYIYFEEDINAFLKKHNIIKTKPKADIFSKLSNLWKK